MMKNNDNNHIPIDTHQEGMFLGKFSELEMILREDFGLDLEKGDVHSIGISLTGYIDTLLDISKR